MKKIFNSGFFFFLLGFLLSLGLYISDQPQSIELTSFDNTIGAGIFFCFSAIVWLNAKSFRKIATSKIYLLIIGALFTYSVLNYIYQNENIFCYYSFIGCVAGAIVGLLMNTQLLRKSKI